MLDYAALYLQYHKEHPKLLSGRSMYTKDRVRVVQELVAKVPTRRILDYGCGKGYQYLALRIHERWGGVLPHCYDVGISHLSDRPVGKFDGVICNDVMEHIAPEDVDEVLADVFSFANPEGPAWVFLGISTRPARKRGFRDTNGIVPDGTNLHLTVQGPDWWEPRIAPYRRDGLEVVALYDEN